ncbi:MAG: hypothetical protein Rhob2KO_47820 [Rhodopirellula baltica]
MIWLGADTELQTREDLLSAWKWLKSLGQTFAIASKIGKNARHLVRFFEGRNRWVVKQTVPQIQPLPG